MGDPIPPLITPLAADEWSLLRRLRLAALRESPDSFSPTYEETAQEDDAYWRSAATRLAAAERASLLVARPDRGLVSAVCDDDGVGHIGAMWVDPDDRGRGLGASLLDAAIGFLDESRCRSLELSVTEGNARAIALYESRRFALTGRWEPLREGSPLRNLFMRRARPAQVKT